MKPLKKRTMLTAYDVFTARVLEDCKIDYILVGDSLGMVVYGDPGTQFVTMYDMIRHTQAVRRGAKSTKIIVDMPYNSYISQEDAVKHAKQLIDAGGDAVKLEGAHLDIIEALTGDGIRVFGHLGLLPQTAQKFCMKGKTAEEAADILQQAKKIDTFGLEGIILECIPEMLAQKITDAVSAPTFGIGAGKYCDGQVLVSYDILGMFEKRPRFAKQYEDMYSHAKSAINQYIHEVTEGTFP